MAKRRSKSSVTVRNPYKEMFKGTSAKKKDGMHRPEGAGNFDNMDESIVAQNMRTRLLMVETSDPKIKFIESDVLGKDWDLRVDDGEFEISESDTGTYFKIAHTTGNVTITGDIIQTDFDTLTHGSLADTLHTHNKIKGVTITNTPGSGPFVGWRVINAIDDSTASWADIPLPVEYFTWSTIACDNGTNPTPDQKDDTLTLTSGDGSIIITGTQETDKVDFEQNHPTTYAPSRSLNTTYQNSTGRPLMVWGSVGFYVQANNATAYADCKSDASSPPTTIRQNIGVAAWGLSGVNIKNGPYHAFCFIVQDTHYYRIDTTTSGTGSVATLQHWHETEL